MHTDVTTLLIGHRQCHLTNTSTRTTVVQIQAHARPSNHLPTFFMIIRGVVLLCRGLGLLETGQTVAHLRDMNTIEGKHDLSWASLALPT